MDIIIKNGVCCIENALVKTNIGIKKEKISFIENNPIKAGQKTKVIDATGMLVLPGVIDSHTHFDLQQGAFHTADDFATGTYNALLGGVTTIIDYVTENQSEKIEKTFEQRQKRAANLSHVDFAFHVALTKYNDKFSVKIRSLLKKGIASIKLFMIYKDKGWMASTEMIYQALKLSSQHRFPVEFHAEDDSIIENLYSKTIKKNLKGFLKARNSYVEVSAVSKVLAIAKETQGIPYFVHLSCGFSPRLVAYAKRRGLMAYAETCPHYLVLDDSVFKKASPHFFATCPPVKGVKEKEALWNSISENMIDVVATDHCAFTKKDKNRGKINPLKLPFGIPGVSTLLPLLFTYGYKSGKISIIKLASLLSKNPASIFNLPKKGEIKKGFDADIIIIDPEKTKKVKVSEPYDYSPYEGMNLYGFPDYVISRGTIVNDHGKILAKPGRGRFLSIIR